MKTVLIRNRTLGTEIGHRVECADRSLSRLVGLIGRRGLAPGSGLWIRPSSGIHTFGMSFAIDAVGLDGQMRVVRLWPNLQPWRVASLGWSIRSVVELAAGRIEACSIELGHTLEAVWTAASDPDNAEPLPAP